MENKANRFILKVGFYYLIHKIDFFPDSIFIVVKCHFPFMSNPFISIGIGSFDMVSGIKMCHKWVFTDQDISQNLEDTFKISLSNVHRQNESTFSESVISYGDMQNYGWFMLNSTFIIKKNSARNTYYNIGFILKPEKINININNIEIFTSWINIFTTATKKIILKNEHFEGLNPIVDTVVEKFTRLSNSSIPMSLSFDPIACNQPFLSMLLTSHLRTQMTTVIESSSEKEALELSHFLSYFTLPYQKELSSFEFADNVTSGLFIQCVKRQPGHPSDYMILFSRPVTWVRLPERQILKPDPEDCKISINHQTRADFMKAALFDNNDPETKKTISRFKAEHKIIEVKTPAPWAIRTIALIIQTPKKTKKSICEKQFGSLIRIAVLLVLYTTDRLESTNSTSLTKEQCNDLQRSLRIVNLEDFLMILSVAHLYDKDIFRKVGRYSSSYTLAQISSY